ARCSVRFSGMGSPAMVEVSKFVLGALEHLALLRRERASGAIDVEVEHRHRRAKRCAFAPFATFGRSLERARYGARAAVGKDAMLEIERVARAHDARRPALGPLCSLRHDWRASNAHA